MAGPWQWDCWLSLSPACLCPLLLPLPCPTTQETVAPADNAQQQAHFHKYKASGVGWGEGRGGWGCPTPLELLLLPPAPSVSGSNLRFPPALKIALAACFPGSPGNKLPEGELCQVSGDRDWGFPPQPPNSEMALQLHRDREPEPQACHQQLGDPAVPRPEAAGT